MALFSSFKQHSWSALGLLVPQAFTSLTVLYIQKQLHWLAGSAKKRKILKKSSPHKHLQPCHSTTAAASLGQAHVRAASRPLPRSIQNQIARDILTQSPTSPIYTANSTQFLQRTNQIPFHVNTRAAAKHPDLMPHHHPNKASWSLILHLHWDPTLKTPSKNQLSFAFSWTFFKGVFLVHLGETRLSTQKAPQGTYDLLDFTDPQSMVVLSGLLHCRGKYNVTSWILGGNSTSLPSK